MLRSLSSYGERVLAACHQRHLLSPIAESRVRHLCQRGLSVEQALVGTGLLSIQQYGELLSDVTGLPFVESLGDQVVAEDVLPMALRREHSAHPFFQEGQELSVGFARPEETEAMQILRRALRKTGVSLQPFVMLQGEWRRYYPSDASPMRLGSWLRQQLRSEHARTSSHIIISHDPVGIVCRYDGQTKTPLSESFPSPEASFSALRLLLERVIQQGEWMLDTHAHGHEVIHLVRQPGMSAHHALHAMQALEGDEDTSPSLTIVLDPDRYAEQHLASTRSTDLWQPRWYLSIKTPMQAEEALHAVWAGSSGVVCLSSPLFDETRSLWHALHETGIPLRMIRAHRVPNGEIAWESLPFQI